MMMREAMQAMSQNENRPEEKEAEQKAADASVKEEKKEPDKKETVKKAEHEADKKDGKAAKKEKKADEKDTKIAAMEVELNQLKVMNAKLTNDYAKAYADTENMKKRLEKDFDQQKKYVVKSFALSILPVVDDCERALQQETTDEAYRKGVQMIHDKLVNALKAQGVEEIDAKDKPFDGNWHQALMSEHVDGVEPGTVIEVLQKGYTLNGRILRAAMVKVSE
jgi:molecular chaperone GrpE